MQRIPLVDPRVLVLVEGESSGAIANATGHLFEDFVGRLLERYGYHEPHAENVRVTARGIELDLSVRHRLTGQRAIAECKAYTSPVRGEALEAFYGKLTVARFDDADTQGFFVALPRLTAEATEQASHIMDRDNKFRVLVAQDVVDALSTLGITRDAPRPLGVTSDPAVVITEHGVYSSVIELDPIERTAARVLVWGMGPVPAPVKELIAGDLDYGGGMPIEDVAEPAAGATLVATEHEPLVVSVTGSSEDFEYQLPASPRFFIGRSELLRMLEVLSDQANAVVVLNAQSGWGKSSLALKFKELVGARGGHAMVVDARTAASRVYLTTVLRRAALEAESAGLLQVAADSSWATLASSLRSLAAADWRSGRGPLLVFFDQFENVFKDVSLTREFRDLALGAREVGGRLLIGFAWKTDLVGWTEGHPYQLRDDIRAHATVLTLEPLGAREVETLLRRLEKRLGQKLLPDLRQRLREYSGGLPWLLKKLAGHLIREVSGGVTQERLLAEALNVQNLFEADLAELQPIEQEALRFVARFAPVAASEVMERASADVVQSLIDRRLLVQVGERLDTYWDIFRDFLNTGRVPIEDSYILRQTPRSVARLLGAVAALGGNASVTELTDRLNTSENAIFNLSRELRLMGVTAYEPNRVRVADALWQADDREEALRRRVTGALRRHRAFSAFLRLADRSGGKVQLSDYARELPGAFPAVEVAGTTWQSYARAFVLWFEYAGLVRTVGQAAIPTADADEPSATKLYGFRPPIRAKGAFPQQPPGPGVELLLRLAAGESLQSHLSRREAAGLRDLVLLGAVEFEPDGTVHLCNPGLVVNSEIEPRELRRLLEGKRGCAEALALLERDPSASPEVVGEVIRGAYGAEWSSATTHSTGKHLRGWARLAGVTTRTRPQAAQRYRPIDRDRGHPGLPFVPVGIHVRSARLDPEGPTLVVRLSCEEIPASELWITVLDPAGETVDVGRVPNPEPGDVELRLTYPARREVGDHQLEVGWDIDGGGSTAAVHQFRVGGWLEPKM
jgi:hypothetical protein